MPALEPLVVVGGLGEEVGVVVCPLLAGQGWGWLEMRGNGDLMVTVLAHT